MQAQVDAKQGVMTPANAHGKLSTHAPAVRLRSLDCLRGLTVAFMILVNNAGDGDRSFAQLRHSIWNGCTATDVVFPLFLFLMGTSMPLAFLARIRRGVRRGQIARQVLERAFWMILIGLVLNALPFFDLHDLRFCGVMQRIGICYAVVGLLFLGTSTRGVATATAALLVGYWVLLTHVSVPGYGWPGRSVAILDPQGNLASYLDRLTIPLSHRYHQSFYDPEGLLSTLGALASTGLGVLAGRTLQRTVRSTSGKAKALAGAGAVLLIAGLACSYSLPLNKRLWTSSYVLVTAGISLLLLAIALWGVDEKRWLPEWILYPFEAFGRNALAAYMLSELLAILIQTIPAGSGRTLQRYTYLLLPQWLGSASCRSLIWSFLFVVLCLMPMLWMRRRNILLKL